MIRKIGTDLYSTGGSTPYWKEKGKMWKQKNHVTSHLSNGIGLREGRRFYINAEIVEFEIEPVQISTTRVLDYIEQKIQEKKKEDERHNRAMDRYEYEQAKKVVDKYERDKGNLS